MRLIDADALKRYIDCGHLRPPDEICLSELAVVQMVDRMPTIEAEPVTRCKDCRHLLKDNSERKAHLCVRERIAVQTSLEDYCSHAEPKR